MRKLIASTFVSLDGVMQAPGGPEEDPTGVFAFGGWSFSYWDEVMDQSMRGFDGKDRELVLGRRTYEIFEAYWPYQPADNRLRRRSTQPGSTWPRARWRSWIGATRRRCGVTSLRRSRRSSQRRGTTCRSSAAAT